MFSVEPLQAFRAQRWLETSEEPEEDGEEAGWMDEPGAVLVDQWRYSMTLWTRGTPVDPHIG